MNLKYFYWFFPKAFSPSFCNKIIELGKTRVADEAVTGGMERDLKKDPLTKKEVVFKKKIRRSKVAWLTEPWLYKELAHFLNLANQNAGWNFQHDWFEDVQFTYYGKGDHYDWHIDEWDQAYSHSEKNHVNLRGKIRKLSMTINLSDPNDYKGGDFMIGMPTSTNRSAFRKVEEVKPQGSVLVFPSFLWHKVAPVRKGKRYSLVVWTCGKPWK